MHRPLASTVLLLCSTSAVWAQSEPTEQAVRDWLQSKYDQPELLSAAVEAILDAEREGIAVLARELRERPTGDSREDRQLKIGIDSLFSNVVLGFLARADATNMAYAGQFAALRPLQPQVGRFLIELVVDSPPWFPDTRRGAVVPMLRDVYTEPPAKDDLDRMMAVANNEEIEAAHLRNELSYALAQWGRRELVDERIVELDRLAGSRQTRDELFFVRELAQLHYDCRDYPRSAQTWEAYLAALTGLGEQPGVGDLYRAACSQSLAGRVDSGVESVEACCAQIAGGDREVPEWMSRRLFDDDPDLAGLRARPRFAAAVDRAYPEDSDAEAEPK